jgi:hypothetical protein
MEEFSGVELDDVSYYEFVQFEDDKLTYYKRIGMAMKPDSDGLEDIMNWPYGKVKELQMMFQGEITMGDIPQLLAFGFSTRVDGKAKDRTPEEFIKTKWHKVFQYYNHLTSELKRVIEREEILAYEPEADQVEAGIERINQFGVLATIDTLAQGNVLLYDEIEAKPYYLIFAKLHLESEKARYIEALSKIKERKSRS